MGALEQAGGGLDLAALSLPYPEEPDLETQYRSELAPLQVGCFDGDRPDAYSRLALPSLCAAPDLFFFFFFFCVAPGFLFGCACKRGLVAPL